MAGSGGRANDTRERAGADLRHSVRRMLQALDSYWEHCDGLSRAKCESVRGRYEVEDWWHRWEKYRAEVEAALAESRNATYRSEA